MINLITGLATFMGMNPKPSIIVVAVVVTLISTLLTKWLTNQDHLRALKKRQKEIQGELKKCNGDECKMKALNAEIMQITGAMMKSSFKPLYITFIPFAILFFWLKGIFIPIMGTSWFWWYLGSSLVTSMALRKILNMA